MVIKIFYNTKGVKMNETLKDFIASLNEDVQLKLKNAADMETLIKILENEGITLDPCILESASGGSNGFDSSLLLSHCNRVTVK